MAATDRLETFAAQAVGHGELVLLALIFCAAAIGFLIALLVSLRSKRELQRAPYFVFSVLFVVLVEAAAFSWLWADEAIAQKRLWIVVGVNLLALLTAGYGFGVISAARARDATGSTLAGFVALIPLANLFLFFQPSRAEESPFRFKVHPLFRGLPGVLLGLLLICLYFALNAGLHELRKTFAEKAPWDPEAGIEFLLRARGLEGALAFLAEDGNRSLPQKVNESTRLATLTAKGKRLTRTYIVTLDKAVITPEIHRRIERNVCAYKPFKPLLREGAEIEEIYKTVDGVVVGHVVVRRSVCDALGGKGPP